MARAGYDEHRYSPESHFTNHIVDRLALAAAHILALSLVNTDLDDIRLHFDKNFKWESLTISDPSELLSATRAILLDGLSTSISTEDITSHLRRLLGHEDLAVWQNEYWVASSSRGQVLFPQLFETMRLERQPCLAFIVIPGILTRADQSPGPLYRAIISKERPPGEYGLSITVPSEQILGPSQFNSLAYEWRTRTENDFIIATLSTKEASGGLIMINVHRILMGIPQLVFANSCQHNPDERLNDNIEDYKFIHPNDFFSVSPTVASEETIIIFATRGNDPLRMMILGVLGETGPGWSAVIGQMACLTCSLNLCRRLNCRILIC
jgi:hypothetical protein